MGGRRARLPRGRGVSGTGCPMAPPAVPWLPRDAYSPLTMGRLSITTGKPFFQIQWFRKVGEAESYVN